MFGLSIALIDGLLRLANNQYSPFIALFVVSACVSVSGSTTVDRTSLVAVNGSSMKLRK